MNEETYNESIKTDADVTGPAVRAMRNRLGLSLQAFWKPLGVHSTTGGRFETEIVKPGQPVRTLIFMRYVAGLDFDTTTEEGAEKLRALAKIQTKLQKLVHDADY